MSRAIVSSTFGVLVRVGVPPDRYRIEGIVSDRGRSLVFRARDLPLDRQVLLEIFGPEGFGSAEEVARFTWETLTKGQLKSEHVRRISDVGIWSPGSPYIAREFFEGRDLATWLQDRGALPQSQAVDFVMQACDALAEAHSLGIVHRDIKPANLFAVGRPGFGPRNCFTAHSWRSEIPRRKRGQQSRGVRCGGQAQLPLRSCSTHRLG
jgi:serine/threonine protein kinase